MKNSVIKHIVIFFSIVLIFDVIGGGFLKKHFFNISFGTYGAINNSLKSEAKILILGSSRAMHHYNPEIISTTLNQSCYNSGLGGHGLFLNYAILDEKIKSNKPKIVILDLSPNVIVDNESYSKLNLLLPYYQRYSSFKEIIILDSKFSKLELISKLYVYNSTLYDFIRSYSIGDTINDDGFVPLSGYITKNNFEPFFLQNEIIDINKIVYLNKIIDLCKNNNIKLIGVVSPTYTKFDKDNRIITKLETIFFSNDVEFYDYSDYSKLYQNSKYFKDQLHMNSIGSDLFSEDLSKKIKERI